MDTNKQTKSTNNSLTKKTKAQLIDIILRKDDVEKELKNNINDLKNIIKDNDQIFDNTFRDLTTSETNFKQLSNNYNNLLNNKNRYKSLFNLSVVINVLLLIILYYFYLY